MAQAARTLGEIRALLWDFGDTLADERFMLAPLDGAPGWSEAYRRHVGEGDLGARWNDGRASAGDVAAELAAHLNIAPARVLSHMQACSQRIAFFPLLASFCDTCALPQAIVTVNPDIFSTVIVPAYGLDRRFPVIVTSWQAGTSDKGALCEIAIGRLDPGLRPEHALLIDNRADNLARWQARGGLIYLFRDPMALCDELGELCGA